MFIRLADAFAKSGAAGSRKSVGNALPGHGGGGVHVLKFLEVDAAAAGLHLPAFRGVLLDEIAAFAADTDREGVIRFFPRRGRG